MGSTGNYLTIQENGKENTVCLDSRSVWPVGRVSIDGEGIVLRSPTVSRQHGVFMNIMGTWYYYDKKCTNATIYNGKKIKPGIGGRTRPVMLHDGDVLMLGARSESANDDKTVYIKYTEKEV